MNAEEFRTQVVPLYRKLFATAMALLHDSDEASDTVQDSMTRLWEMRQRLDELNSVEAFAVTMTRRMCIDRLRANHASPATDSLPEPSAPPDDGEQADDVALVERIIASLPQSQQTVIRLSAFDDRSNEEIAQLTGFSPPNVRQLLSRARKRIKELFNTYQTT